MSVIYDVYVFLCVCAFAGFGIRWGFWIWDNLAAFVRKLTRKKPVEES